VQAVAQFGENGVAAAAWPVQSNREVGEVGGELGVGAGVVD
jgi:hypothetical protein